MTMMLSPELLDRRALALIALVDPFGRPLAGPALLTGDDGFRTVSKSGGRWAILACKGLESHVGSFESAPAAPNLGSVDCTIDIRPADGSLAPRRAVVPLPRDPDPASRGQPDSLFEPVTIALLPSPQCSVPATAAAVRVTVRKRNDGRRVANALVRVASNNGQFTARSVTDAAGEALVIVPDFPMSFTGGGGSVSDGLPAKVTAVADPAVVVLVEDAEVMAALAGAAGQSSGWPDPDALADAFPVPASGAAALQLSTRVVAMTDVEWRAP
jgi:hypothetical protein